MRLLLATSVALLLAVAACGLRAVPSVEPDQLAPPRSDARPDTRRGEGVPDRPTAPGDLRIEAAPRDAVKTDASPDAKSYPLGNPCGSTECIGETELTSTCQSDQFWWNQLSAKCATSGRGLVFFELSDPCPTGHLVAKYACCPPGTFTTPLSPSTPGCPPLFDSWPVGAACSDLVCNYPTACGAVTVWHCKGGWSMNSSCSCGK